MRQLMFVDVVDEQKPKNLINENSSKIFPNEHIRTNMGGSSSIEFELSGIENLWRKQNFKEFYNRWTVVVVLAK